MASNTPSCILRVAVACPLFQLFDYLPPENSDMSALFVGMRVQVPFARGKRFGVIVEKADDSELPLAKLKRVLSCTADNPLSEELLRLCRWSSDYYHHPLGDVITTAMPSLLRRDKPVPMVTPSAWQLTQKGRDADLGELARAPRQQAVATLFLQAEAGILQREQLADCDFNWQAAINQLIDKQWLTPCRQPLANGDMKHMQLNDTQVHAVNRIADGLDSFHCTLLEGVTGSGKTEVYFDAMAAVLKQNKQCLLLVPEIGLTPQLSQRLASRFQQRFLSYHSGLSEGERARAWQDVANGEVNIIVGTRSAVFLPLANAGIIIIDEEHDLSYKQQDGFRYHARDLAIRRAQQLGIPIVLGSATPSLESSENARKGRYQHLHLPKRGGGALPPSVGLIDMRRQSLKGALSPKLIAEMTTTLEKGEQVLVFVNRRGYAPALLCHDCGWIAKCHRCDANMTLHQAKNRLICHHCGAQRRASTHCDDCDSEDIQTAGFGTEQVEETLKKLFPYQNIVRIDRDTTANKGSIDKLLHQIEEGRGDILVGTQMIAKGHHLPNVTLAAILNADQGLFAADFRALEHLAQLIVQVIGRAGRGSKPGKVFIQTHHPDHGLLQTLINDGYQSFSDTLITERQQTELPPFSFQALLRAEATNEALPIQFLDSAKAFAQHLAPQAQIHILGPIPAPMAKRAGRFRAQLLIQAKERRTLHQLLYGWVRQLGELPLAKKVRWSIDVDPMDMN